jgi:hypothetical protein
MSEISDMVKAVSLAADAREATLENEIKSLQQRLALKDREIMRLRKALEEIAFEADLGWIAYNDLMAWHNEQLGEPVAWMWNNEPDGEIVFSGTDSPYPDTATPLYAKKGLNDDYRMEANI